MLSHIKYTWMLVLTLVNNENLKCLNVHQTDIIYSYNWMI